MTRTQQRAQHHAPVSASMATATPANDPGPPIEPVVWPPRSPSARLMEILRAGLGDGESLVGPEGRWVVHGG